MIYKIKPESRKVVVVTGCASGLGLELARELYDRPQYHVVITARDHNIEELKTVFTESERFKVRALDVTNDDNIYKLINEIALMWGRVDCIINNAAICYRGVIEHMDSESELIQLKTNYLGPMSLTRAVLPIMREQKSGRIINISSVSGMLAMPTMASYSASKHALEGATEALWYEAKPFGINVSLIELGFLNSDSFKKVVLSKKAEISSRLNGPHSEYYKSMTPFIERLMRLTWSKPKYVAHKIIDSIEHTNPPLRMGLTIDVLIFNLLKRLLPSQWLNTLLFWMLPDSLKWGNSMKGSSARGGSGARGDSGEQKSSGQKRTTKKMVEDTAHIALTNNKYGSVRVVDAGASSSAAASTSAASVSDMPRSSAVLTASSASAVNSNSMRNSASAVNSNSMQNSASTVNVDESAVDADDSAVSINVTPAVAGRRSV